MFSVGHWFRYSLLYSVLRFFITTLLGPYSESKNPTRWGLTMTNENLQIATQALDHEAFHVEHQSLPLGFGNICRLTPGRKIIYIFCCLGISLVIFFLQSCKIDFILQSLIKEEKKNFQYEIRSQLHQIQPIPIWVRDFFIRIATTLFVPFWCTQAMLVVICT